MASEFPKLKKKLEHVKWKLNKKFNELLKDLSIEEEIELVIDESSFVALSPINKSVNVFRNILDECIDETTGKISHFDLIGEEHIYAAKGLLKLGKYSDTSVDFLTEVLGFSLKAPKKNDSAKTPWTDDEKKNFKAVRKLASDALSECRLEISIFGDNNTQKASEMFITLGGCINGSRNEYDSKGNLVATTKC
jgi:hypothetical protein